ncbi:MAG: hypothetical protein ACQEQF_12900 [Bacillota bacterium]
MEETLKEKIEGLEYCKLPDEVSRKDVLKEINIAITDLKKWDTYKNDNISKEHKISAESYFKTKYNIWINRNISNKSIYKIIFGDFDK